MFSLVPEEETLLATSSALPSSEPAVVLDSPAGSFCDSSKTEESLLTQSPLGDYKLVPLELRFPLNVCVHVELVPV